MPLDKSLFEKKTSAGSGSGSGTADPPRRKWGKAATTGTGGSSNASSDTKPRWGASGLKKTASNGTTTNGTTSSASYNLKPVKKEEEQVESVESKPPPAPPVEEPAVEESTPTDTTTTTNKETDMSSTVTTESTEDMTAENLEASAEPKTDDETVDDKVDEQDTASTKNNKKDKKDKSSKKSSKKDKDKESSSSSKKKSKKKEGSPFALEEGEYLKEVPPEQRTTGTFDWSGVDSVLAALAFDKKMDKKRAKLQEKLDNINATKEDALKMMRDHVQEQKDKMDDKKREIAKRANAAAGGMTYTELVDKVKEQHEIVATLKKSNNKLRKDTDKMHAQVRNLRVNNMKLEAANEQSEAVLEQLKERKKSVDARYEHLTKVIIPPYQERIKEMQEVVEERKSYGRNEHRTRVRYGNYIIRFLDKVDRSEESDKFKMHIFELAQDVEGGDLHELESDEESDDDEIKIEMPPPPPHLNESINLGDMTLNKDNNGGDDADSDDEEGKPAAAAASSTSPENSKTTVDVKDKEDKSLWNRFGSGGNSKSGGLNDASSSSLGGKNSDLLQKASRAKAANFNGAVILSDSDDDDSDSDDSDDS